MDKYKYVFVQKDILLWHYHWKLEKLKNKKKQTENLELIFTK